MPRYAVLEHDHPALHWDFLLESGPILLAWRLSAPPGPDAVDAEQSFDHRLLYLDYEGFVSGDRGSVRRWDGGLFEWKARETDRLAVLLAGTRLNGVFRLDRINGGTWRGAFTAVAVS